MPKQRPRIGVCGRTYTPKKTQDYESKVGWAYLKLYKSKRTKFESEVPLQIKINVFEEIPKSWCKSKKDKALAGEIYPVRKDVDNIAKSILDGLNGVAFHDDSQVVDLWITKSYYSQSFVEIVITDEFQKIQPKFRL